MIGSGKSAPFYLLTENMQKQIIFRGLISGDLNIASNNKIPSGIYYYQGKQSVQNAPGDVNWGIFIQVGTSSYYFTQIIVDAAIGIKTRKFSGYPASWSEWK